MHTHTHNPRLYTYTYTHTRRSRMGRWGGRPHTQSNKSKQKERQKVQDRQTLTHTEKDKNPNKQRINPLMKMKCMTMTTTPNFSLLLGVGRWATPPRPTFHFLSLTFPSRRLRPPATTKEENQSTKTRLSIGEPFILIHIHTHTSQPTQKRDVAAACVPIPTTTAHQQQTLTTAERTTSRSISHGQIPHQAKQKERGGQEDEINHSDSRGKEGLLSCAYKGWDHRSKQGQKDATNE